jgi:hypothetical protein
MTEPQASPPWAREPNARARVSSVVERFRLLRASIEHRLAFWKTKSSPSFRPLAMDAWTKELEDLDRELELLEQIKDYLEEVAAS